MREFSVLCRFLLSPVQDPVCFSRLSIAADTVEANGIAREITDNELEDAARVDISLLIKESNREFIDEEESDAYLNGFASDTSANNHLSSSISLPSKDISRRSPIISFDDHLANA